MFTPVIFHRKFPAKIFLFILLLYFYVSCLRNNWETENSLGIRQRKIGFWTKICQTEFCTFFRIFLSVRFTIKCEPTTSCFLLNSYVISRENISIWKINILIASLKRMYNEIIASKKTMTTLAKTSNEMVLEAIW